MMYLLWKITLIVLVSCQVKGDWLEKIESSLDVIKSEAERKTEELREKVANAVNEGVSSERAALMSGEALLDKEVAKAMTALVSAPRQCVKGKHIEALTGVRGSLVKCSQLARVISDGVDIGREGVQLGAEILGTLDDFLQSLSACIVGPAQSAWNKAACYLGTIGTLGSGIASNIQQVEFYATVVKRDVADIKAAIKLCLKPTGEIMTKIRHTIDDVNACKMKI